MVGTFLKTTGIFLVIYFLVKKAGKTLSDRKRKQVLNSILVAFLICFIVNLVFVIITDIKIGNL